MNVGELKATLDELNIPKRSYSINESISSDIYIFRQVYTYWECFYIDERGNQNNAYQRFDNESDACLYFLQMLKASINS